MSTVNLNEIVREVCDSSAATDPATLAKEVFRRIDEADHADALLQALPVIVQHRISRTRSPITTPTPTPARPSTKSWKVQGIRSAWQRMLRDRICVGPDSWKFIADCTITDLEVAAHIREDHARRNAERAAQLRRLIDLMVTHHATTVADLDESIGATSLTEGN